MSSKSKLKSGDSVIVIAGNDKGRTGTVRQILAEKNRIVIEGINVRWKHKKATQQAPQGERVQQECSIHASNVMFLDPATNKGTRKRPQEG